MAYLALLLLGILIIAMGISQAQNTVSSYDLIILGATPGGIMAAVAASRTSNATAKILILERTKYIGGLPANGLGATDIATYGATGGLFIEFVNRIKKHYVDKYGAGSKQVRDCNNGYHFEPKVAEEVMKGFLREVEGVGGVEMKLQRQFDVDPKYLEVQNDEVRRIRVLNRNTKEQEWYRGKYFVDATYEGDLIAAAKVPFFLGREPQSEYNELGAGKIYKYWNGEETTGTTHEGDGAIQSYNYRLSITRDLDIVYKIPKPASYNREEYVSLIADIITGCHTGIETKGLCPRPVGNPNNRPTDIPGTPNGINRITNPVLVPNNKWDGNNQHLALISTDLPQENWAYPTESWEWRDEFAARLRSYTLGLFYFAQNDPEVPAWYRKEVANWGLAKDEYLDNNHFPRQVYVREGRRMHGEYIFTSHDAVPATGSSRPPIHKSSITSSHYALDSHGVRKREPNRVSLDGMINYKETRPYTVPFGVILPVKRSGVNNLLAPVPVSGSHIGFSTLRMEPCWMALGQATGTAVALLLKNGGGAVYDLEVVDLQRSLLNQGAILVYESGWQGQSQEERVRRQFELLRSGK